MVTTELIQKLARLSGMAYRSGHYTASEWEAKTGVNPAHLPPGLVQISPATGLCTWLPRAESLMQAHRASVRHNWHALGVPA